MCLDEHACLLDGKWMFNFLYYTSHDKINIVAGLPSEDYDTTYQVSLC